MCPTKLQQQRRSDRHRLFAAFPIADPQHVFGTVFFDSRMRLVDSLRERSPQNRSRCS